MSRSNTSAPIRVVNSPGTNTSIVCCPMGTAHELHHELGTASLQRQHALQVRLRYSVEFYWGRPLTLNMRSARLKTSLSSLTRVVPVLQPDVAVQIRPHPVPSANLHRKSAAFSPLVRGLKTGHVRLDPVRPLAHSRSGPHRACADLRLRQGGPARAGQGAGAPTGSKSSSTGGSARSRCATPASRWSR